MRSIKKLLKLSVTSCLVSLGLGITAAASPMTIADLQKLETVGAVTISPDGKNVAYTVSKMPAVLEGEKNGGATSRLFLSLDGAEPRLFVGGKKSISRITFGPKGDAVYFISKRGDDKNNSLYKISLSGGEAEKVYGFESSIGDYALTADETSLFFISKPKKDKDKMKEKGFNARIFEEGSAFSKLYSVNLSDGEAEAVYEDEHVLSFDLSDDDSTLALSSTPTTAVDDSLMLQDITVISTSGDVIGQVDMPGKLTGFELSPNGSKIAMFGGRTLHDPGAGVLMVADSKTGEINKLTSSAKQHIGDVEWVDGDILTLADRREESFLVLYDESGEEITDIEIDEDLVIHQIAIANGKIAFAADSATHPREAFLLNLETSDEVQKLSNHNSWLENVDMGTQSTFTYTAGLNREISGVLITPKGRAPRGGWPTIIYVHGGPESHVSDGWLTRYSLPGQIAAGQGYAVYHPNYRGSTGRGVAYSMEHQNDYAGKEFNDLVAAKKALVKAGIAHEDKVGITGGSYGGYASMWGASALTEHFAASVAFVGISNQISKFGTSDIPNEMYLVHSRKWPWDDNNGHWQELLERSPIFHAGKTTTPTLIMHGEQDTRVHPGQSMEYYRAVKVRTDTPVRLVFYPGEGHGNRKAAAKLDYAVRLHRWMDTYLKDGDRDTELPSYEIDWEPYMSDAECEGKDCKDK